MRFSGQCQAVATLVSTKCCWGSESGDFPNSDQSALGIEQLCLPRHAGPHLVPAYIHTWVSPLFSQGSPYLQHSLSLSPYSHRSVNLCPITVSRTQTKSHGDCSIRQRSREVIGTYDIKHEPLTSLILRQFHVMTQRTS